MWAGTMAVSYTHLDVYKRQMEMLKPLIIPSKGKAILVYPCNKTLLRNTRVLHEKKQAEIKNDTLYVEGKRCV